MLHWQFSTHQEICEWLQIESTDGSIPTAYKGRSLGAKGGSCGVIAHAALESAKVKVKEHEVTVQFKSYLHSTGRKLNSI